MLQVTANVQAVTKLEPLEELEVELTERVTKKIYKLCQGFLIIEVASANQLIEAFLIMDVHSGRLLS
jgi:hypothetical protein